MFQTIRAKNSLDEVKFKAEAQLSDMFFILYLLYQVSANELKISKYGINKLITYLLDDLEKNRLLEQNHYFNLPLYKWQHGTFNQAIENRYLKELTKGGLVKLDPTNAFTFFPTEKAIKFIEEYKNYIEKDEKVLRLDDIIDRFSEKYLAGYVHFGELKEYSHGIEVKSDNKVVTVHDLANDDSVAVVYNKEDFTTGKIADIVPQEFLTKLAFLIQENQQAVEPVEQEKVLSEMFD